MENRLTKIALALLLAAAVTVFLGGRIDAKWFEGQKQDRGSGKKGEQPSDANANAQRMLVEGKHTFRYNFIAQ